MGGIAGEDDALMDKSLHAPALELVDRDPAELKICMRQHALDSRAHIFRQPFDSRIGGGAELQVDAPFTIGLPVQQRRLDGVEDRVEPKSSFRGELTRDPAAW